MPPLDFGGLPTERRHPGSRSLDRLSVESILRLMNSEDRKVPLGVARVLPAVARAVETVVKTLQSGGKIIFLGAGTSGRLGVLESAELPPTFGTPPRRAQAVMAGGRKAVFRSQEGAEDDASRGKREIGKRVRPTDAVVGIAASGVTPFVRAGLREARGKKAQTILVTCNAQARLGRVADIVIAPDVGPEVIAGSTRLKSGTATKLILNMISTAAMVRLGKVHGNRMVDLQPKSRKLRERGIRLVREIAGVPRERALRALRSTDWQVKTAILMIKKKLTHSRARRLLNSRQGFLSRCL